jgi:anti-sigma B factor antagonist
MALKAVPEHVHGWVEVSEPGDMLVLRICGELDVQTRDSIEPAVIAAIASSESVIIDLGQLTFCDSHGIAMFIAAHEKAATDGTAFTIRGLSPTVKRLFVITGLDTVIDLVDD